MDTKSKKIAKSDIPFTQEDESVELSDMVEEAQLNKKISVAEEEIPKEISETVKDSIAEYTDEKEQYVPDSAYPGTDQEYPKENPDPEFPKETEPAELVSDIEIDLMDDPEKEKNRFYEKHVKKSHDLLHPYKDVDVD